MLDNCARIVKGAAVTVLVTGATGLVGRSLVGQLLAAGATVRALSRRPETADLPDGVEVVGGDVCEPASLVPALAGVDRVYLFTGGPAANGFAGLARDAGVECVVMLSGLGTGDPASVEQPLAGAGLEWTHLRPGAFSSNALWQWGEAIRTTGTVRGPYWDAAAAPIHEADIAAVAATALLRDGHGGQRYVLTGPESLTYRQQIARIAQATGREITVVEEAPQQARERMLAELPEPIVDRLLTLWADAVGHPATVQPTVEDITGRPARSFAQWAGDHVADFQ